MTHILITVVIAHFLALLSPGPDFLLVVKSGVKNDRGKAVGVAMGIASANGFYIFLCLIGVGVLIAKSILLMEIMKICGGLFLTYLGIMALRAKKSDYACLNAPVSGEKVAHGSFLKEFGTGFLSAILNPKNPIFYLSLFSVVLNKNVGFALKFGLGIWMTTLVFLWDASIIYVLSRKSVKSVFSRATYYVDKVTGTVLGFLGLTLIRSAFTQSSPAE